MARRVDIGQIPYLRMLFYGMPGSTKTRTAASAVYDPRTSPVLLLNAAGNPVSIRDYDPPPDIIDIEELKDVNAPYDWIRKGQDPNDAFCRKYELNPPYKTLIVDQLTDVQRMSFAVVTGNKNVSPGNHMARTTIQHFGSVLGQMVNFAKLYYSLPIHVIMTCLEKADKNEQTGAITYAPLLWGQSSTEVGGYAFCVARLTHRAETPKKALRIVEDADQATAIAFFAPSSTFYAKDQYGTLGPWMADPSIPKMANLIFGDLAANNQ